MMMMMMRLTAHRGLGRQWLTLSGQFAPLRHHRQAFTVGATVCGHWKIMIYCTSSFFLLDQHRVPIGKHCIDLQESTIIYWQCRGSYIATKISHYIHRIQCDSILAPCPDQVKQPESKPDSSSSDRKLKGHELHRYPKTNVCRKHRSHHRVHTPHSLVSATTWTYIVHFESCFSSRNCTAPKQPRCLPH